MGFATQRISKAGGYNTMFASPLATDKARAIVRPSPDLAYSSCPYDLSNGPVLVDVEPVPAPYWSLSVFDARTDVAFVRNNIEANGQPIRIAIALAGQPVPDGMQAVRVKDASGIALIRILVRTGAIRRDRCRAQKSTASPVLSYAECPASEPSHGRDWLEAACS